MEEGACECGAFAAPAEAERSRLLLTLARQEGFEPPTYCLEGSCSILLSYWRRSQLKRVERVMGIEPTYPAWKAGVLPLNYTRASVPLKLKDNTIR